MSSLSLLAIVAHPDDAELGCGGALCLHTAAGQRTGVIDLSQGEAGTRGSAEERRKEAAEASKILGLSVREQLHLPDGFIIDSPENRMKLIRLIRRYRPQIVLTNTSRDRHPDHGCAAELVTRAAFLAGLPKISTEDVDDRPQIAHRPRALYYFMQGYYHEPDFILDISSVWEKKVAALAAYRSQFHQPAESDNQPQTHISTPAFQKFFRARAQELGFRIGAAYGEAFFSPRSIGIQSLDVLL